MIRQCKFSDSVKFFKDDFFKMWDLKEYTNVNESSIFFGCYSTLDVQIINAHKGKKIVFLVGADVPNLHRIEKYNVTFASDKQNILDFFKEKNVPYIDKIISVKDYSNFNPTEKGSKIYVYKANSHTYEKFKLALLEPAIKYFGEDMFLFGVHGNTMQQMIDNYYKPSFINIQLNPLHGFATACEMAYMGRKSISNNPAPFALHFKTPNDIIELIKKEINNKEMFKFENYLYTKNDWLWQLD